MSPRASLGLLFVLAACGGAASQNGTTTPPSGTATATPSSTAAPVSSALAPAPTSSASPPPVARAPATQLAARGDTTCSRHADGSVRCWGDNRFNVISNQHSDLGHSDIRRPQVIPNLPPVAEVGVGEAYACARLEDGTVRCWGTDDGDLGLGTPLPPGPPPRTEKPMPVLGLSGVASLSVNGHVCALLGDKSVTCWADYDRGNGDPRDAGSRAPVVVPGFAGALQIADGGNLSCARLPTQVKCFSDVSPGLIPKGKVRADPFVVAATNVASIVVGSAGGCAITTTAGVSCWGQVPFVSSTMSLVAARPVPTLRDVVALAMGQDVGCVIVKSGDVLCVDASMGSKSTGLTKIAGVSGAVEIAVGESHACARTSDGNVLCWGDGREGQLGDGSVTSRPNAAPVVW